MHADTQPLSNDKAHLSRVYTAGLCDDAEVGYITPIVVEKT